MLLIEYINIIITYADFIVLDTAAFERLRLMTVAPISPIRKALIIEIAVSFVKTAELIDSIISDNL